MKYIVLLLLTVVMMACSKSKPEPALPEEFLTLADVSGRPTLVEDSPDVRVMVETKSFIKQNDLRTAKTKAVKLAAVAADDEIVRELLPSSTYNENYEKMKTTSRETSTTTWMSRKLLASIVFSWVSTMASLPLLNWKNQSSLQIFVTWFS